MTLNKIKIAIYSTVLVNFYGLILKFTKSRARKKELRFRYSRATLKMLNITLNVVNPEKLPKEGQYLFLCNHRSVIDPTIVECLLEQTSIFGYWIAKKELYNSFFFGLFVRNAGTILLDREASQMGGFFKEIKEEVKKGDSIFMFPEGTRNTTQDELTSFKDGSRIIALKNRLPILPIYIKTHANDVVMEAVANPKKKFEITVIIGDVVDYKDKNDMETTYRTMFDIPVKA